MHFESSFCTRLTAVADLSYKPELEDAVGVVTSAHEDHPVPDAEMVDAWDDEHSSWGILLQVLVLNRQAVIFAVQIKLMEGQQG